MEYKLACGPEFVYYPLTPAANAADSLADKQLIERSGIAVGDVRSQGFDIFDNLT
jgi:hypothetical protein